MASNEFKLVSPAIDNEGGGKLPRFYTQEGVGSKWDISPPLEWHNPPPKTKRFALVAQDIDIVDPAGNPVQLTHWVVVNIPATVRGLPEGFSGKEGEVGAEFKLYALDYETHFDNQVTKQKLLDAIAAHTVGEAILTATF